MNFEPQSVPTSSVSVWFKESVGLIKGSFFVYRCFGVACFSRQEIVCFWRIY